MSQPATDQNDAVRALIERGRVLCLCGRRATGTTPGGEPECADLGCHAAEEVERLRLQLASVDSGQS